MSEPKRQHTVPQFYLRAFSPDSNSRSINVFNIGAEKYITRASISRQAYRNYFYGKDGTIERKLSDLEGFASSITGHIIAHDKLPEINTKAYNTFLLFILLLKARTPGAANETAGQVSKYRSFIESRAKQHSEKEFEIPSLAELSVTHTLGLMAACSEIALDLNWILIKSDCDKYFFTSDDPVVFYNQYLERKRSPMSSTGLATKGLEILCPISPRHYIMYYDGGVYDLSRGCCESVAVADNHDVLHLNKLQMINCDENIFCHEHPSEAHLKFLSRRCRNYRSRAPYVSLLGAQSQGASEMPFEMNTREYRCKFSLSFMNVTPEAMRFSLRGQAPFVRDPRRSAVFPEYVQSLIMGEYKAGDFDKFLRDKGID